MKQLINKFNFQIKTKLKIIYLLFLESCFETDTDFYGYDIVNKYGINDQKECQEYCQNNTLCNFWTYQPSSTGCFLKTADSGRATSLGLMSGPKFCSKLNSIPIYNHYT